METFRMPIMLEPYGRQYFTFKVTEAHRRRAHDNHQQTLERQRDRGGLDPGEMLCVLQDRPGTTWKRAEPDDLKPFGELEPSI